jgi:hypothetical protein
LALRYRAYALAAVIMAVNLAAGVVFVKTPAGWLPVVGSCVATIGIFTMSGVPLRCVLLASTLMWLSNNIISGSIGGTLLEMVIATANISTMVRIVRSSARHAAQCPGMAQSAES